MEKFQGYYYELFGNKINKGKTIAKKCRILPQLFLRKIRWEVGQAGKVI